MPRVAGSSQAILMQYNNNNNTRSIELGGATAGGSVAVAVAGGAGMLGANTSIATSRLLQSKESFSPIHRNSSTDSTRSTRSVKELPISPRKTSSSSTARFLAQPASSIGRVVSDSFTAIQMSPSSSPRLPTRRRQYRASEGGKGELLPSYHHHNHQTNHNSNNNSNNNSSSSNSNNGLNSSNHNSCSNLQQQPQNRQRTFSLSNPVSTHVAPEASLRSRRRTTISSDEEGNYTTGTERYNGYHYNQDYDYSHGKGDYPSRNNGSTRQRSFYSLLPGEHRWMPVKSPHFFILLFLFCIACFTAGSYHKVFAASQQLDALQQEESILLVHLHKVEEQLMQLHEVLRRLTDRSEGVMTATEGSQRLAVDADLVDVQMRKLREMEAELDHEVRSLQTKLSESAKRSIIDSYGEGAVQVDLDISFGDNDVDSASNTITIRLWYDTPHTAWTFLQQVQRGGWNGAKFSVYHGRALLVQTENGGQVEPQVDFIEQSQHGHDRYTVGLTDTGILLNIQDNREYFKKEASVGVITGGFDTLRKLVAEVEASHGGNAIIRSASVSHLRKENTK